MTVDKGNAKLVSQIFLLQAPDKEIGLELDQVFLYLKGIRVVYADMSWLHLGHDLLVVVLVPECCRSEDRFDAQFPHRLDPVPCSGSSLVYKALLAIKPLSIVIYLWLVPGKLLCYHLLRVLLEVEELSHIAKSFCCLLHPEKGYIDIRDTVLVIDHFCYVCRRPLALHDVQLRTMHWRNIRERSIAREHRKDSYTHPLKKRFDYPCISIDVEFTDDAHVVRCSCFGFLCPNHFLKQRAVCYVMSQGLAHASEALTVERHDRYPDLF